MNIVRIPKGNGKFRVIYVPDPERKAALRRLVPILNRAAGERDTARVQHGFTPARSPVTNAEEHLDWRYTLSFDLADFFDTVSVCFFAPQPASKVYLETKDVTWNITDCFVDGQARQGLPTSPALANIAASKMDGDMLALKVKGRFHKPTFVYTRYADDLTFSFDVPDVGHMLMERVPQIIAAHGFRLNESKTRWQSARAGRRHITGIAVDESLHPTRAVKRRLRAGQHQIENGVRPRNHRRLASRLVEIKRRGGTATIRGLLVGGHRGLKEWARLRPPAPPRMTTPAPVVPTPAQQQTTQPHGIIRRALEWVAPFTRKFIR